jgi:hypothetical protein
MMKDMIEIWGVVLAPFLKGTRKIKIKLILKLNMQILNIYL